MSSGESRVQRARRAGLPAQLTEKQEAYARYSVVPDKTQEWAYFEAGYKGKKGSRAVTTRITALNKNPLIQALQNELLAKRWKKIELTAERIEREYMAIAFSRISDAAKWGTIDMPVGKDDHGKTITRSVFFVEAKNADEMGEDTLAALKTVSIGSNGGVKVEMHDKMAALNMLARRYKRFVERTAVDKPPVSGNVSFSVEDVEVIKGIFDGQF